MMNHTHSKTSVWPDVAKLFFGAMASLVFAVPGVTHAADNELTAQEKQDGWVLLFDGKSVAQWKCKDKPMPEGQAQEGCINTSKQGVYVSHFDRMFTNFHFMCDFRFEAKCNSGIFIHGTDLGGGDIHRGVEIQVFDSFGKAKPDKHDAGAVYDLLEPSKNAIKPAGEWNHIEIISQGSTLRIILNGETVIDTDFAKWTEAGKNPDGTKNKFKWAFKDQKPEGYIGLQDHGHPCWYKNLKVKPLQ
ncbi:MAG: DUF1080 domain-containing protein [Verrucomicrobiota bacterium]